MRTFYRNLCYAMHLSVCPFVCFVPAKPRLHQGNKLNGNMLLVAVNKIYVARTSNLLPGNMLPWCKRGLTRSLKFRGQKVKR